MYHIYNTSLKGIEEKTKTEWYTIYSIDGNLHTCLPELAYSWDILLNDFKPFLSGRYCKLYRTKCYWVLKNNDFYRAIKYKSFWKAISKFMYYQFHGYTVFITKIRLYFNITEHRQSKPSFFRNN